jgi:poly(A) polymerase
VSANRQTPVPKLALELGQRFVDAGFELALVGGWVRDTVMNRGQADLDFTTNATPEQVMETVKGWADGVWDVGIRFGTVGVNKSGQHLEITTYRAEQYEEDSRKPSVRFGNSLEEDLARRDFSINSIALSLPGGEIHDPFGGVSDIAAGLIRTPLALSLIHI